MRYKEHGLPVDYVLESTSSRNEERHGSSMQRNPKTSCQLSVRQTRCNRNHDPEKPLLLSSLRILSRIEKDVYKGELYWAATTSTKSALYSRERTLNYLGTNIRHRTDLYFGPMESIGSGPRRRKLSVTSSVWTSSCLSRRTYTKLEKAILARQKHP